KFVSGDPVGRLCRGATASSAAHRVNCRRSNWFPAPCPPAAHLARASSPQGIDQILPAHLHAAFISLLLGDHWRPWTVVAPPSVPGGPCCAPSLATYEK
ncbi:MAG: hypothetical protein ABJN42_17100, partial [Roseibium sp.]|uniref:hypothetical protein n=1 Tax=Roseibium sp. TaxID=1936156 RepID=UPI00329A73B0